MEDFIRLEKMSHIYHAGQPDEHEAVKDIDLSVHEGEFLAVLGANGSGKSTLAKHFNALLLPTAGHCIVGGMDTAETEELWRIRQQVGMVFQNPDNQIIAAIVEDDVAFGPENLGVAPEEIRKRVSEALHIVGMEHYRKFAPHLLSGGQKQRIAIAGALAMHTRCLVFDEPTAMLDPQGRAEVMATVKRLHEEAGITIIYITHFMEEAAAADRIIVMAAGSLVEEGTPAAIFAKPAMMQKRGLAVPLAAEAAYQLRQKGVDLPAGILTQEDLVKALCRLNCRM
jgi:energy-coupling factor transport system ATP-binding protein